MKLPLVSSSRCLCVAALLTLILPLAAGRAQDPAADPAAAPTATPRPRPKPAPTPDPSLPAGTVNGVAIYRPLMKSELANPLDRALVINDFNTRGNRLSAAQIEAAVSDVKRARFNGDDAKLDAKLKALSATPSDFRQFATEEAKVHIMLAGASRGSVSEDAAKRAQSAYIAGLRQRANVNKPKN